MSLVATKFAWDAKVNSTAKLVLLRLADHANDDHICWPSIPSIAAHCRLGRSTTMRAIKELIGAGLISVEKGKRWSNVYRVMIGTSVKSGPVSNRDGSRNGTGLTMALDLSQIGTAPVPNRDPNLPRSSKEPINSPRRVQRAKKRQKAKQSTYPLIDADPFHQQIVAAYNDNCPHLTPSKEWGDDRAKALEDLIEIRISTGKDARVIAYWQSYFAKAATLPWLVSRDGQWIADIDYLLKPANFRKVSEALTREVA